MSYSGLATRYRPKRFGQIVGQPDAQVVKAIFKDLSETPPLLIFNGPSGVGKTTIARIIGATVNCENRTDSEPCGACAQCEAVFSDSHINVYEMDAASHGTADALRDLVLKTHLQSNGIKTFILDEAQSISGQGWNVLLKVLEEPPPDCLFILLSSEPRKIPTKIRTRALRFNFKDISPEIVEKYLSLLVAKKSLVATAEDISTITDMCAGSLRDALMMLEQCTLSDFSAGELFGNRDLSLEYLDSLLNKDYPIALATVDSWWSEVGEAKTIISQLATTLEKVAHAKTGVGYYGGSGSSPKYRELATVMHMNAIASCLEVLSDWFSQSFSKAQLVLMTARLYKALNGSIVVGSPIPVATHDTREVSTTMDHSVSMPSAREIRSKLGDL